MMKRFLYLLIGTAVVVGFTGTASAINLSGSGWQNITGYDGFRSTDHAWYDKTGEDNEVEDHIANDGFATMADTQDFDLEAVFYNRSAQQIAIVGGYDSAFHVWPMAGDVFVTAGNGDRYVMDVNYESFQYTSLPGDIDPGDRPYPGPASPYMRTSDYTLYSGAFSTLGTNNTGSTPPFDNFAPASGPWRYDAGGALVYTGSVEYHHAITEADWGIDFEGDAFGDNHNVLLLTVPWLSGIDVFSIHNTMQDGGDMIRGQVPEPATFLLFGAGLIGVAGLSRRKKS
ncbi:MAG: PEP-CTERM sorting domain-containing protein [Deltaproteobacteria bacterium]|nr:PEP-CTERM sorting domain-containing protein [Deltaproteobacteria bacterium]